MIGFPLIIYFLPKALHSALSAMRETAKTFEALPGEI
jgi:hypothetical protein